MNRRRFIQSLAAALALPAAPALSLKPVAAALPSAAPSAAAATALATKARFWTIYMYGLHGNCTPATLSTMLNISETQARGFLNNLIADGTIRPHALLRNSLKKVVKGDSDGVVERLREPVETTESDEFVEVIEKSDDALDVVEAETADENNSEMVEDITEPAEEESGSVEEALEDNENGICISLSQNALPKSANPQVKLQDD